MSVRGIWKLCIISKAHESGFIWANTEQLRVDTNKKTIIEEGLFSHLTSHIHCYTDILMVEEDMLQNPKSIISAEVFSFNDGAGAEADRGGSFLATLGDRRRRRLRPASASQNIASRVSPQDLVSTAAGNRVVGILVWFWSVDDCSSSLLSCFWVVMNAYWLIDVALILKCN